MNDVMETTIQGSAPGVPKIKDKETGPRSSVVCVLPFEAGSSDEVAHRTLCHALARDFGGFTRSIVEGGWLREDHVMLEAAWRYEVSFAPGIANFERARELFIVTGAATGQTWIHIEDHPRAFQAAHVKI